ncbi:MAG: helix-turn-helix domain-containing protein, partial [Candidatus Limnocylindrales bacterium]
MARVSKTRPRVDESPLARQIGERLRRTRLAAGLTQQQLAEGRYTKAYVSALENGLSRPSMAALNFFSNRLAIPASKLINDEPAAWARLEADLALASGRWDDAIAAYRDLLESTVTREARAELMSGLAEALIREGKGREATPFAAEAARIFHAANREAEAALSEYWLSAAHYLQENGAEAKALLQSLLSRVRAGLRVEPDFELRLVMALSSNESREDNHVAALAYL